MFEIFADVMRTATRLDDPFDHERNAGHRHSRSAIDQKARRRRIVDFMQSGWPIRDRL